MKIALLSAFMLVVTTACGGAPTPTAIPPIIAPSPIPATVTSVAPTATRVAPTATPIPPTATRAAPTDAPIAPTATRVQPTATRFVPTATIVYYPITEKPWDKIPTIVISSAKNDPKIPLVQKAVEFWNQQLKEIGTPFRLGSITEANELVPNADLVAIGNPDSPGQLSPNTIALIQRMPGDLILAFSDATFVSVTHLVGAKKLIAIQANPANLNSLTVDQNVIAHEMGHAIGLGHNDDPNKLMCGRPAPCRPNDRLQTEGFFPLTDEEKAYLLKIYPPTWKPTR